METNKKKQTQRQKKNIYYDFMRFGDSSTVHNSLKQEIAFIRDYLGPRYYLKDLNFNVPNKHAGGNIVKL